MDCHFPNPFGGDCDRTEDLISQDQLIYMLGEFDNIIYPTDTAVLGEPLARGDEGQKTWILIFNIREDYGASCAFQLYLFEKHGGAAFASALVEWPRSSATASS